MARVPDPPRVALFDPFLDSRGGGEKYVLRFGEALERALGVRITLLVHRDHDHPGLLESLRDYFGLALEGFEVRRVGSSRTTVASALRFAWATRHYDLLVYLCDGVPRPSLARRRLAIVQFPFVPASPAQLAPWQRLSLPGYELVVYSRFAREWVARRWGRGASVIAPPVTLAPRPGSIPARENVILSVGRFFRGGHQKRHREMVETFAGLRTRGLVGWQLHLAGTVADRGLDREAFEEVRALAESDVVLHPNATLPEIESLYGRAKIYWHAAGAGVDEQVDPECVEHFGMTTAESMAFGCVPVVIGRGGQPEIVSDGECGYLCQSLAEMGERTLRLAADPGLVATLSAAARRRSSDFNDAMFERAVRAWLDGGPGQA